MKYERVVAEGLARGRISLPRRGDPDGPSVNEVLLAYWKYGQTVYVDPGGKPSLELDKLAQAIVPLKELYGETATAAFGPVARKAVRPKMIDSNLARTTVNQRVSCIKRIFKWAVGEERLPPDVYHGLQAVHGSETGPLRRARDGAGASRSCCPCRRRSPFPLPTVQAMVRLQRVTGMRSGELCLLRHCDLEIASEVWFYSPGRHKTHTWDTSELPASAPRANGCCAPCSATISPRTFFHPAAHGKSDLPPREQDEKQKYSRRSGTVASEPRVVRPENNTTHSHTIVLFHMASLRHEKPGRCQRM